MASMPRLATSIDPSPCARASAMQVRNLSYAVRIRPTTAAAEEEADDTTTTREGDETTAH